MVLTETRVMGKELKIPMVIPLILRIRRTLMLTRKSLKGNLVICTKMMRGVNLSQLGKEF